MLRQDEYDELGVINRMNDRTSVRLARNHVARRDPTGHAGPLQRLTYRIGHGLVLRSVTDECTGCLRAFGGYLRIICFDSVGHARALRQRPYSLPQAVSVRFRAASSVTSLTGSGREQPDAPLRSGHSASIVI